ncbi:M48 family metalloprotease [Streptomyces hydrogenans]|uniref:M48 family metalloprotease n=1 Tax=Streptomyces hydrogenans TaxID=1873719 RepID=UPI0037F97FE8
MAVPPKEFAAPTYPGEAAPPYPEPAPEPGPGVSVAPPPEPPPPPAYPDPPAPAYPDPPTSVPAPAVPHGGHGGADGAVRMDDLELATGRRMVKARQRGVDGAALWHLLLTVPTGLLSLGVVTVLSGMVNVALAVIVPVAWLLSGPLVFHRRVEAALARRLFGMRRPTEEEARRLDVVWEQVTRRAGVDRETYELWIQERAELNATAAAGHIVAVTRHALDRLPDTRLAAVLAHELGHHVGGHSWAAMLADWYATPARVAGRLLLALVVSLFGARNKAGFACGGCLTLTIGTFLFQLAFLQGMWWLLVPFAVAPVLIGWLHRVAEFRADAYAVGLGFGEALEDVLVREGSGGAAPPPGTSPVPPGALPAPHLPYAPPGAPYAPPAPAGRSLAPRAAHANVEARLRNVRLVRDRQVRR